ncbi:hypothetical protein ACFXOM_02990 [Streptomyces sp. NPDC059169]|uniref:hypothetical protein n=1 Tax=Streptomyces sp. NPDC059169 TaxID=3346754 RepID=UPI0036AAFD80
MSASAPEESPGDRSPISDAEWAEFARQAEHGAADAPKEPSARARMVTARLRAEDERSARQQRRWGRKPKRQEPEGWRTGPAWQEMRGGGKGRRRLVSALGVLLGVALAVVAVRPELVTERLPGAWGDGETTPLAAETTRPTAAPPEDSFPDHPTVEEPFRGSPAARWADGADGIVLPPAKAVGGMSKDQVEHALRSSKALLVAANLDAATLRGGRPGAVMALLDPLQSDVHGMVDEALRKPGPKQDPLWLFSRFDPTEVRLVGDVVKARGRMTFGEGDRPGEVRVHVDYTFVYPLVKAESGADEVARTIVRRQMTFALYDPARTRATSGKLHVLEMRLNSGNSDCARNGDGFLRPQFVQDLASGASGAPGPTLDPYDRSKDIKDLPKECGTVTRT